MKAIVLDLDGTLLTPDKKISPFTKATLLEAQKSGMQVILASGRPTSGMEKYATELELSCYGGWLISYNGAVVWDCHQKKVIYEKTLEKHEAKKILQHLENFAVLPLVDHQGILYYEKEKNKPLKLKTGLFDVVTYEANGGNFIPQEVANLVETVDFPIYKILTAGNPAYLKAQANLLAEPFKEFCHSVFTADFYFEFTAKNMDKAQALKVILEKIAASPEEVIAFGDGLNDASLLNLAGIGVAMENAVPQLKVLADVVTSSNEEDGVAIYLKNNILSGGIQHEN